MNFDVVTTSDIAAMLEIERQANPYPWPESAFKSSFSDLYRNIKLTQQDTLVGFVICKVVADQAELFNICVNPAYQGQGFGKQLLQQLILMLQQSAATELWLEVRASNTVAKHLYETHGFNCVDVRPNYYQNATGKEDALIMCLYLP